MFEAPPAWTARIKIAARVEGCRVTITVDEMNVRDIRPDDALAKVESSTATRLARASKRSEAMCGV